MMRCKLTILFLTLSTFLACSPPARERDAQEQDRIQIDDPEKEKVLALLKQMEEAVTQMQQDMDRRAEAEKALAEMEKEVDHMIRAQLKAQNKEVEAALTRMQELIKQVAQARAQQKPPEPEDPLVQEQREVREALNRIENQIALLKLQRERKQEQAIQALAEMQEAVLILARAEKERREKKRQEALAALKKMELELAQLPIPDPRPWAGWNKELFEDRYHNVMLRIRENLEKYRERAQ